MYKTWTSGAIELLSHADGHIKLDTAFDKRIAFISIDNAVEITVKTYLSLPKQFFGTDRPSRKEIEECNNGFTNYLSLLFKYAEKKLIGIDPGDIEHYHRIRNTLYHDGTGLAVDHEYLTAYSILAKLLLKRLFNIDFKEQEEWGGLEKLILNWNHIEELLAQIMDIESIHSGTYKWEDAISRGLLTADLITDISILRQLRNKIVHSKSIDSIELSQIFNKSKIVLQQLKKQVDAHREEINSKNYFFGSHISVLTGKLTLEDFYGPPNYGETPEYDLLQNVWILNLQKPINVFQEKSQREEFDFDVTQYDVDRIQLALGDSNIEMNIFQGKLIKVEGLFWGAHTGYHYTPVLMDVIKVTEV